MILEILLSLITPSFLQERAEIEPKQGPSAMERTSAQPAEPDRNALMRVYRNLEFADTPQEREQLHASLVPSTERKMSPEVFSSFAERFDLGRQSAPDPQQITLSDEIFDSFAQRYGFAAPAPVLTQPVTPTPSAEVAQPVFKDEAEFQKTVEGAPAAVQPFADVAPAKSFGETFKAKRAAGEETFLFDKGKGKGLEKFTTLIEGETAKRKAPSLIPDFIGDREQVRGQLRRGAYEQSILPVESQVPASTVVERMENEGIVIDRKQLTPDIGTDIQESMIPGAVAVKDALAELNLGDAIVTSGKRVKGKHASFHEIGLGMDFSLRNVKKGQREELYARLTEMLPEGFQLDRNDMFPRQGSKIIPHIHIELDTAESKSAMRKAFKAGLK